MNTIEADVVTVVSVLFTLPIFAVWAFVLVDIVRRADLRPVRKLVYGVVVVVVFPAALLYLLARPTSLVRHHGRGRADWRSDLMAQLESTGERPLLGPSEERALRERVRALRS